MNIDLLTPEFIAFTEEVKKLYAEKEQKVALFKEVWLKHKAEIEALESKAEALQQSLCSGKAPVPAPVSESPQSESMSVRRSAAKKN